MFTAAAAITVVAAFASAPDSLTVTERMAQARTPAADFAAPLYENPALKPLSLPRFGRGEAGAGYIHRHGSRMALGYDPDQGERLWRLQARASVRAGSGNVWGHAAYETGRHIDRRLCLGSDYEMIYPYVNATLSGGDMRQEHYRFGGGWGASIAPRWQLGATLGYDAGHAYRTADPRPRNITGLLRASVGAAFRIDSVRLTGLSLTLERYTQSNSTTFVSDMGQEMIYHLTGLGTQYRRFAGLGPTMNYSAYEPGAALQFMHADGYGPFASARYSHLHLRCLLTALNHLPMAAIDRDSYRLQAGWLWRRGLSDFGVEARYEGVRRSGSEGIFGDAVSGVYPRLGSQRMYTHIRDRASLSLLWSYGRSGRRVTLRPSAAWLHERESYDRDARLLRADRLRLGLQAGGEMRRGRLFHSLTLDAGFYIPCGSELRLPADGSAEGSAAAITDAMLSELRTRFRAGSGALQVLDAGYTLACAVSSRHALGLDLRWQYAHSAAGENFNTLSANINFYF